MTSIEKLEDILHKEKLKKLQEEIDELPDYHTEWNNTFNGMCDMLHSGDLKNSKVHHSQTAWRDKYIRPQLESQQRQERLFDLKILKYAHISWAIFQVIFCFVLLYICSLASMV